MADVRRDSHRRFLYRGPGDLRQDIATLGLDVPWEDDPSPLLEPLEVGTRRLPNRLGLHPMEGFDARTDGGPDERTFRRYKRFAEGGSGLLWFEATAVLEEARSNPHQLWIHSGNLAEFRSLVSRTREAAKNGMGSDHRPLLVLQLTHSGRWSRPGPSRRPVIAHHVEMLDEMVDVDGAHALVSDEELDRLQGVFLEAARLAASAGFDGVDIKACHGYLTSELLGAHTREGRYGGPLENRARFLLETVERIRTELPDLLVTSRLNVFDGLPHPFGFGVAREDPEQPDLTEPRNVLESLLRLGCPMVNITLGVPYCRPHLGRPFNRSVPGSPSAPEHPLVGVARFLEVTGMLQRALPGMSLVGTGYSWLRHFFPQVGAGAVRRGRVSVVGVGRMGLAYPDFAKDLAHRGELDPRKVCVGCSGCSELMKKGMASGCVVRDGDVYQLPRRGPGKGGGG
jgi:2,4-dienoyl-CoA reductase-like NADH-dependent reductase (Old Yellow Enzyme family)